MKSEALTRTVIFLAFAFGMAWGIVIPVGIELGAFVTGEESAPGIVLAIGAIMFVPLFSAFVTNRIMGPQGRMDLCLRPRVRENLKPYAVAWLAPAVLTALGVGLYVLLNPARLDLSFSYIVDLSAQAGEANGVAPLTQQMVVQVLPATVFAAVVVAPFINAVPAFGEEAGWRGLLFPSLCELMGTKPAAVATGAIWGIWHAPVMAMGHNYGMETPGFPFSNILVMVLACVAVGVLLAYARLRTASVWPCALAHGALNATANLGLVVCSGGATLFGPSPLALVSGIPLFVAAAVCLVRPWVMAA